MPDPNELLALALRGGSGLLIGLQTRLRVDEFRDGTIGGLTYKGFILGISGDLETFQFTTAAVVGEVEQTTRFPLPPGWLVGCSCVQDSPGEPFGGSFVRVSLEVLQATATIPIALLFAGFVTGRAGLSYPKVEASAPEQLSGAPMVELQTQPAVGASFLRDMTNLSIRRLSFVRARLGTSAVAANRRVSVRITDGANVAFESFSQTLQVASTTIDYVFSAWGFAVADVGTTVMPPLPPIGLQGDLGLRINVAAIDIGDQLSLIYLAWDKALRS